MLLAAMIKPIPLSDLFVSIMAILLEIGASWMSTGVRRTTDKRNTLAYVLENVPGKCMCPIRA